MADWNKGDEVVLDYKRYEKKTVKFFVDALYQCNADPISLEELIKLLQMMSKLGYSETVNERTDFPCTLKERVISAVNLVKGLLSQDSVG